MTRGGHGRDFSIFFVSRLRLSTSSLTLDNTEALAASKKTGLFENASASKLWLVSASAAFPTIIPQASWALLATWTSSLVFLFAHCNAWLIWGAHDPFFLLFLFHLLFLLWGSWLNKWSRAASNLRKF